MLRMSIFHTHRSGDSMRNSSLVRRVAICTTAVAAGILGLSAPAQAADRFFITCIADGDCSSSTYGDITFYNRTAQVTGTVFDSTAGSTTAVFEAFVGDTKTGSQTRFADNEGSTGANRGFNFTIGNSQVAGDVTRIKITVCKNFKQANERCGRADHYNRG